MAMCTKLLTLTPQSRQVFKLAKSSLSERSSTTTASTMLSPDEDISVTHFRQYLQIPTPHPEPNLEPAVEFLTRLADDVGLAHRVVRCLPDKPIVIMTWLGKEPMLPSIMLNSHVDVVPVFPQYWKYGPFSAHKDQHGNIYARGSQDTKCTAIQHIEAIRRLKLAGVQCLRNVHVTIMPDEEIGGELGMCLFVKTPEFKSLNLGLSIDEGSVSEDDVYKIQYAERVVWHLKVTCCGNPGHGSRFIENTAAEKMQEIIKKFLQFRAEQQQILKSDPSLATGNVTTVNLTILHGGVQVNVVPAEFVIDFDIRVPPTADFDTLSEQLESYVKDAGADYEWVKQVRIKNVSSVIESDPWWKAFSGTMDRLNLKYKPGIDCGASDSRFLRQLGYPAYGFSPIINTPTLLHDHNEYLNEKVYLDGVHLFEHLIPALANVEKF